MTVLLLALLTAAAPPVKAPPCRSTDQRRYATMSTLPSGVAKALGFAMAEKGEAFQETDVIQTPRLPDARFVSAARQGCTLTIHYERGGFVHRWMQARLLLEGGRWRVIGGDEPEGPVRNIR